MAIGDTVFESNTTENGYGFYAYAGMLNEQTITPQTSHAIYAVRLKLTKTGSPTGNIAVSILDTDLNVICVSNAIAMSAITDSTYTFTFTTNPVLPVGIVYIMDLACTGGDASNYIGIRAYYSAAIDIYPRGAVIGMPAYWDWYFVECGNTPPSPLDGWQELYPAGDIAVDDYHGLSPNNDAVHLAVCRNQYLYTSVNGGVTWTKHSTIAGHLRVSTSRNGQVIVAASASSLVHISTDGGANWADVNPSTGRGGWTTGWDGGNACDEDGSNILVSNIYSGSQTLWKSTDYGVNWTQITTVPQEGYVRTECHTVASDNDGSNLFIATWGTRLYVSADGGANWTETQPRGDVQEYWDMIASGSDGSFLIIGGRHRLYTSVNGGSAWTERRPAGDVDAVWDGVACDSTGAHLLAGNGTRLYSSADGGINWREELPVGDVDKNWHGGLSINVDGSVVMVANSERLYIKRPIPPSVCIAHSFPWLGRFQLSHVTA